MLEADQLESSSTKKDLRVLVHNSLNTRQQCTLAAKSTNSPWVTSRSREEILPLCSAPVKYLECWVQVCNPHYKGQIRESPARKMIKRLKHLSNGERLRERRLFSLRKGTL